MKTTKLITTTLLFSTFALAAAPAAFAAEGDASASDATIGFTTHDSPTGPVNPENPSTPITIDPKDPDKPTVTGQNGPLSLDVVPNFHFGKHEVDLSGATYKTRADPARKVQNYLQVSDHRTDKNGWTVSVKRTPFVDTAKNKAIEGTTLSIPAGVVRNEIRNQWQKNEAGVQTPVDPDVIASPAVTLADGDEQLIFTTKSVGNDFGKATTTSLLGEGRDDKGRLTVAPTELTIPAGQAKEGRFVSDLTWTMTASVFK
ncbi:WxL domain-containing protein [Enterococcus hirae]|nr:WxL domain-containing protein [Enterococcus hirae]